MQSADYDFMIWMRDPQSLFDRSMIIDEQILDKMIFIFILVIYFYCKIACLF